MPEKTPIKLSKIFGMKISAEYQSYDFGSVMELTLPKEVDLFNTEDVNYISRCTNWLSARVIESTVEDIKAFAADNDSFRAILASRNKNIEKIEKLLDIGLAKTSDMKV